MPTLYVVHSNWVVIADEESIQKSFYQVEEKILAGIDAGYSCD